MDPTSSLPAIAAIAIAFTTSIFLTRSFGAPAALGRFTSIDGLRGFLAFFVFLHHSCIWYFYLHSGKWDTPPSNLYTHFGQSSVVLFFMITGFLFFSKLIDSKNGKIDWGRLFVSRILRLTPLYFAVVVLLFIIVFVLSKGKLHEPFTTLLLGIYKWLGFTIFGTPDLNGIENTKLIVAGVVWSLPYEWVFYFSLPLLALTVGVVPPVEYILISAVFIAAVARHPNLNYLSFAGGILAACCVRFEWIREFFSCKLMSAFAIVLLVIVVAGFSTTHEVVPILLLSIFFLIVASGNSLFGILKTQASRTLGEFSYGIYLTHGLIIFVTFKFIIGFSQVRALSVLQYWTVIAGLSPAIVLIGFFCYRFIEQPAMLQTQNLTALLTSVFMFGKNRVRRIVVKSSRLK